MKRKKSILIQIGPLVFMIGIAGFVIPVFSEEDYHYCEDGDSYCTVVGGCGLSGGDNCKDSCMKDNNCYWGDLNPRPGWLINTGRCGLYWDNCTCWYDIKNSLSDFGYSCSLFDISSNKCYFNCVESYGAGCRPVCTGTGWQCDPEKIYTDSQSLGDCCDCAAEGSVPNDGKCLPHQWCEFDYCKCEGCSLHREGDYLLNYVCDLLSEDLHHLQNGNLTIDNDGITTFGKINLHAGSTFIFDQGKSIIFQGGHEFVKIQFPQDGIAYILKAQ